MKPLKEWPLVSKLDREIYGPTKSTIIKEIVEENIRGFMTLEKNEVVPFEEYLYRYPATSTASERSNPLWHAVRRASAHRILLSSYSPFVKYTPQYIWLEAEFKKVDKKKTPWLTVIMHNPVYNSTSSGVKPEVVMTILKWCNISISIR